MHRDSIYDSTAMEHLRGRATGALFFTGLGSLWMYTGLVATHHATVRARLSLLTVFLLSLALSLLLLRRSREVLDAPIPTERAMRGRRMFTAVAIIQWVSVATAISILALLHLPEYVVTAVAIIVGLHLFPLAEFFRNPQYYATGTLLLVWSLGCLATQSRAHLSGISALGVGTVLLGSAGWTMLRNLGSLRVTEGDSALALGGQDPTFQGEFRAGS